MSKSKLRKQVKKTNINGLLTNYNYNQILPNIRLTVGKQQPVLVNPKCKNRRNRKNINPDKEIEKSDNKYHGKCSQIS